MIDAQPQPVANVNVKKVVIHPPTGQPLEIDGRRVLKTDALHRVVFVSDESNPSGFISYNGFPFVVHLEESSIVAAGADALPPPPRVA